MAKAKKRFISVKWKLFAFLMLFVVFMLAVIWLLQIPLLGQFYRQAKYKELDGVARVVEDCLETETLDDAVYFCAAEYSVCIRIFKQIDDNAFVEGAGADVIQNCEIHHLSEQALRSYYQKTLEGNGFYTETKENPSQIGIFWSENPTAKPWTADLSDPDATVTGVVYNRLVSAPSGTNYLIMLYSALTPVNATVQTLQNQFIWIMAILMVGALILAFLISHKISKPITDINHAAKELATGNYAVTFDGKGYREIAELSDTLNYAAEELSKVEVLQQELIANVSHDLRTPLTLIGGYTEMMRDLPSENTPENMQVVVEETARLSELVTDLLDISKLRAGTKPLQLECFDLTDTVREVMLRYEKLTASDGYHIAFHTDGEARVFADRRMILQAIYNLINNAIQYVGEDRMVCVTLTTREDHVRLTVSDHGQGIPPEELPLIWDRYYRANEAHKRAVVGSGLGLSIVKSILTLHGAGFGVDSAVGHGSNFWFELPIAKENDEI